MTEFIPNAQWNAETQPRINHLSGTSFSGRQPNPRCICASLRLRCLQSINQIYFPNATQRHTE